MPTYESVRDNLKTADIVLFSGKGGISHAIKLTTNSRWSHVGMVLRLPESQAAFLWESTTLTNLKDAIDGRVKRGVQLVLLSDRLRTYDGEVSIRHLQGHTVSDTSYLNLMAFRQQVRGRAYEQDKLELIKAAYDGPLGHNQEDLSSLFCSELVAEAYQQLGLLQEPPQGLPSNEYTPKDFAKHIDLQNDAFLGTAIEVAG